MARTLDVHTASLGAGDTWRSDRRFRSTAGWTVQDEGVLGHIGINVPDLDIALDYYTALLPQVGFEPFVVEEGQFAFMPANGKRGTFLFFYPARSPEPYSRHTTIGLQHLAFMVPARSAVDQLHAWADGMASEVIHEPRVFPEYRRRTTQASGWTPLA